MPYFGLYLDVPPGGAEPTDQAIESVQNRIEQVHEDWRVYFNYTRRPGSNASVYVGVSVNGTADVDVTSQEFRSGLEAEVRELIQDVDKDGEIEVGSIRYTYWH